MSFDEAIKGKELLILNNLEESIIYQDLNSNIVWANNKAVASTGQTLSSLIGRKCYQVWENNTEPCADCPVIEAMESGGICTTEKSNDDGRHWRITGSPVRDEQGKIIGAIETSIDITEVKEKAIELRKQKDLLRGIIDGVPDILTILEPDFKVKDINKAGYQALGLSPEQIKGKKCYELQGQKEQCQDCATQKTLQSKRLENITKYNSELDIHVKCYSNPILDEEGNVVQIVEQIRDITSEKLAQEKLEKEKQFINSILEVQSGLVVVLNTSGEIIRFNSACEKVTGYSASEVRGKKIWDLFILEEELENTKAIFYELSATAFPNQNENYWQTKEGELRLISWANNFITDEQGKVEYIVGTGIDITEESRVIKELKIKKKAIHNSKTAFSFANSEGLITEVNNSFLEMWGYESQEEALGLNPFDLHPPSELEKVAKSFEEIERFGRSQGEYKAVKADGSQFSVHISSTAIKDKQGEIQGMMASFIDISESKRAREELREAKQKAEAANRAKSEFLANMSHEIRTPLNAVIGFSEILEDQLENQQQRGYLESIKDAGNNLLKLINNILDISKIEAGYLEIKEEWLDPCAIVGEMESLFLYTAEEKGIAFIKKCKLFADLNCKKGLFAAKLDGTRLRQILINLIGNAVKFTDSGYIKVSARAKEVENSYLDLEFIVEDTGIGVSKAEQQTIFKAFTQQQNQSFEYQGTGLGLTICQRLIEQMGGEIELESELDKGSTFKVIFKELEYKIKEGESQDEANFKSINPELISFKSQQVLIVDDIKSNLEVLEVKLASKGLEVLSANSAEQAIELAKENQPQLIIMDLKMPQVDGYQAKKLIEPELVAGATIIALTAFATVEEEKKVWEAGFDGFLSKPIKEKLLFKELAKHLNYEMERNQEDNTSDALEEIVVEEEHDLEALLQVLEDNFLLRYEEIKKLMIINEVEDFALELKEVAEEYGVISLKDYAKELLIHLDSFDLEKLNLKISDFPFLVAKLREFK